MTRLPRMRATERPQRRRGAFGGEEARTESFPLSRLVTVLAVIILLTATAIAQVRDERAVRAAFVYNLTKYIEWPDAGSQMTIAFVGDSEAGEILKKMLDGKSSGPLPIHVLLSPSEADLLRCQLLYVAEPSSKKVRAALDRVHGKGILTVGDSELFVREGGMIGLVTVGEQVQIQVRLEAAQQAQLKISSRLLSIATLVRQGAEAKN